MEKIKYYMQNIVYMTKKVHVLYTKCSIIHATGLDNPCIFCVQIVKICSSSMRNVKIKEDET